jgi:acyl-coenzyme A synthetase/AMP-(fatty) acid ligase
LYKTGDLVRWLPTGDLDYKGRNDFQIKIHGYRIELEEIESVLTMHPHVGECVVTVKEFNANKYLVVYWTSPQEVNNDGQYVNSWKSIYESQYSSLGNISITSGT